MEGQPRSKLKQADVKKWEGGEDNGDLTSPWLERGLALGHLDRLTLARFLSPLQRKKTRGDAFLPHSPCISNCPVCVFVFRSFLPTHTQGERLHPSPVLATSIWPWINTPTTPPLPHLFHVPAESKRSPAAGRGSAGRAANAFAQLPIPANIPIHLPITFGSLLSGGCRMG